ncbi:hypothetical protein CYMTET_26750 [Cymbomonas tetramitiformis]|uniref:Uncharacterized protein n=1 Tax=Cymbomonas tetramitiformis TaxID=36881 RepID=A0AAE0FSN4_9CHLO|nr:hypothetical protein CYMTET_26750 [Cymbomonas tetramitiformis]
MVKRRNVELLAERREVKMQHEATRKKIQARSNSEEDAGLEEEIAGLKACHSCQEVRGKDEANLKQTTRPHTMPLASLASDKTIRAGQWQHANGGGMLASQYM